MIKHRRTAKNESAVEIQEGLCRQKHHDKDTDLKLGPQGKKAGRETKKNNQKTLKLAKKLEPYPDLRGTNIKAFTAGHQSMKVA
jgi:hypothetical protein